MRPVAAERRFAANRWALGRVVAFMRIGAPWMADIPPAQPSKLDGRPGDPPQFHNEMPPGIISAEIFSEYNTRFHPRPPQ